MKPKHVLILSGDHIYKMNYALMLEERNPHRHRRHPGDAADPAG